MHWLSVICLSFVLAGMAAAAPQALPEQPQVYAPLVYGSAGSSQPPPSTGWLAYLNQLRGLAGLPAVTEVTQYSADALLHSRYMVKANDISHSENQNSPYYTDAGNRAAGKSNLMVSSDTDFTDQAAMDGWITGPFHGIGMLDPELRQVGYAVYREADGGWQMGATLNILEGQQSLPAGVTFPMMWPGDGTTSWLTTFDGNEAPDPLATCPGYTAPSGAPIYLMVGSGALTPNVTASSLSRAGSTLEHCIFSETSFSDSLRKSILGSRDAIVMMPREPLAAGVYTVSITASGTTYTWSFTVAP